MSKYDSDRDSALHFLCTSEWANASFGNCSDYGVFVWRISNDAGEVLESNPELNSVLDDLPELPTSSEFRQTLAGHFIVAENDQGLVEVVEFDTRTAQMRRFDEMEKAYSDWLDASAE